MSKIIQYIACESVTIMKKMEIKILCSKCLHKIKFINCARTGKQVICGFNPDKEILRKIRKNDCKHFTDKQ